MIAVQTHRGFRDKIITPSHPFLPSRLLILTNPSGSLLSGGNGGSLDPSPRLHLHGPLATLQISSGNPEKLRPFRTGQPKTYLPGECMIFTDVVSHLPRPVWVVARTLPQPGYLRSFLLWMCLRHLSTSLLLCLRSRLATNQTLSGSISFRAGPTPVIAAHLSRHTLIDP